MLFDMYDLLVMGTAQFIQHSYSMYLNVEDILRSLNVPITVVSAMDLLFIS